MTASDYFAAEQLYKAGLASINAEIQQIQDELTQVKNSRVLSNIDRIDTLENQRKELMKERTDILDKYTSLQNDITKNLKEGF